MTAGGRAGQARCCSSRPSRWCPAAAAACGQCRLCTRRPPPRTRRWPPRARPPLKRTTGRTRPAARLRCRCCRARRMATGQQPRGRRAAPPRAPAPQVSGLRCATVHVHGFFQVMADGGRGVAGRRQRPAAGRDAAAVLRVARLLAAILCVHHRHAPGSPGCCCRARPRPCLLAGDCAAARSRHRSRKLHHLWVCSPGSAALCAALGCCPWLASTGWRAREEGLPSMSPGSRHSARVLSRRTARGGSAPGSRPV